MDTEFVRKEKLALNAHLDALKAELRDSPDKQRRAATLLLGFLEAEKSDSQTTALVDLIIEFQSFDIQLISSAISNLLLEVTPIDKPFSE